jgi:hypothetical protein
MTDMEHLNLEIHLRFSRCPMCSSELWYNFGKRVTDMFGYIIGCKFVCRNRECRYTFSVEGVSPEIFLEDLEYQYRNQLAQKLMKA